MKHFIQHFGDKITGILSGLDRIRFRGTLMGLVQSGGVISCLRNFGKTLEDFGKWAEGRTAQIKEAALAVAKKAGRPIIHLRAEQSNEEVVEEIIRRDQVQKGLICVLTSMEVSFTYELSKSRKTGKLFLSHRPRLCQHLYHYYMHPRFGPIHTRLQTWLPFCLYIGLNGREWLKCQMDAAGLKYCKHDNTFSWVKDVGRAQKFLDTQLQLAWPQELSRIARLSNPGLWSEFKCYPMDYYWAVDSNEWATDVMFSDPRELSRLNERLMWQGIKVMDSPKVMRFLGRKALIDGRFKGRALSNYKQFPEGVCVKHHHNKNSIKAYTKAGNQVLRVESTINDPRDFKVYRKAQQGKHKSKLEWRPLRKGIADLHRRCKISDRASRRYLDTIATVDTELTVSEILNPLSKQLTYGKNRFRPLRPFDPADDALLKAVGNGKFIINGFRNRDIRELLFGPIAPSPQEQRKQSRQVTSKLRLLRTHGIISKITKTNRYELTDYGRQVITTLACARDANAMKLLKIAA